MQLETLDGPVSIHLDNRESGDVTLVITDKRTSIATAMGRSDTAFLIDALEIHLEIAEDIDAGYGRYPAQLPLYVTDGM
jgi:hypothetical protein